VVRFFGKPFLHLCFRYLPKITDHIILAKRTIAPDFESFQNKCTYIFNYTPRFALQQSDPTVDHYSHLRDKFDLFVIHVGAFSKWRGWPQILDALAKMENQKVYLVGLGRVAEGEAALMDRAKELGIQDRIEIKQAVPYEDMFSYLRSSDLGVMLYQPGILNHTYAFPMKLYDYMAASLPVIGPDFSLEVIPVIEEQQCGLLVDPSNVDDLAKALDWFSENKEEAKAMGCRGRHAVENKYIWENEAEKLLAVYHSLSN